jgi:hypothetical protein
MRYSNALRCSEQLHVAFPDARISRVYDGHQAYTIVLVLPNQTTHTLRTNHDVRRMLERAPKAVK